MKNIKLFGAVLALATAAFVSSCTDPVVEEVPVKVTVSGVGESLSFAAVNADEVNFQIQSDKAWTIAQKDCEWLTITPTDGAAGESATVTVAAADNETVGDRSGQITIQSGNSTTVIPVSQAAGAPYLTIAGAENNRIEFNPVPEESVSFSVVSNVPWTVVKSNLDWCVVEPAQGEEGNATIVVTAEINNGAAREGTITLKSDAQPVVITVAQAKVIPYLIVDKTSAAFAVEGGSETISVSSNFPWTAAVSESWLTVTPLTGNGETQMTITASENTGEARTATVTLTAEGVDPIVISVSQVKLVLSAYYVATWSVASTSEKNATPEVIAKYPGWDTTKAKGEFNEGGYFVGDDGVSMATWYAAHYTPFESVPSYFRSAWSNMLACAGIWKGDGFKFTVSNVTLAAGRVLDFITCGCGANAYGYGYWDTDFSFDGGNTWIRGTKEYKSSVGVDKVKFENGTNIDYKSTVVIPEGVTGANLVVYFHASTDTAKTVADKDVIADVAKWNNTGTNYVAGGVMKFREPVYYTFNGEQYPTFSISVEEK